VDKFIYTRAVARVRQMRGRKRVIQGGTSAGKTIAIIAVLIDIAARARNDISVVAETIPHLRRGAIRDFVKIMQATGRWREDAWNKSLLTYTFVNGSYIEFFSADMDSRLRGARRNYLYINEANNITFEAYYQLAIRTNKTIFLDFNPTHEFWAHTEVLRETDAELLILNYADNEGLDEDTRRDIEAARTKGATSEYWANWWRVYGQGLIGNLSGTIFENWELIDRLNYSEIKFIGMGLDWGYTADPTALIAVYQKRDELFLHELIYTNGLTNTDIANKLRELNINRSYEIIADSAEPKSIEEIYRYGFNIRPATKGADSVNNGIDILQRYKIYVTKESTNLIKELRNYVWQTDKNGKKINAPIDKYNHAIDAVRYVALNKLSRNSGGRYVIV